MAFLSGFFQFLSFPCGIGWMWSISHGITLFENAKIYKKIDEVMQEPDDDPLNEDNDDDDPNDFGLSGNPFQNKKWWLQSNFTHF